MKRCEPQDVEDFDPVEAVFRIILPFLSHKAAVRLRALQKHEGVVISGSAAVQFFNGETYPDSDLDLYVNNSGASDVAQLLLESGYSYIPTFEGDLPILAAIENATVNPYAMPYPDVYSLHVSLIGVSHIFTFYDPNRLRSIQVIQVHHPIIELILRFHSSK